MLTFRFVSYQLGDLYVKRAGVRAPFKYRVRVITPEDLGRVISAYEAARKKSLTHLAECVEANENAVLAYFFKQCFPHVPPAPLTDGALFLKSLFRVRVYVSDRTAFAYQSQDKEGVSTHDHILLLYLLGLGSKIVPERGMSMREALHHSRMVAFETECEWCGFKFQLRVGPFVPLRITRHIDVIRKGVEEWARLSREASERGYGR